MKNTEIVRRSVLMACLASALLVAVPSVAQEPAPAQGSDAEAASTPSAARAARTPRQRRRGGRQEIELQTTSVSGNRELPRVMVVVPWKSAAPAELGGRPIVSLVEEALAPVDPEVFRRELEYYGLLHGGPGEDAAKLTKTANNLTEE